MAMPWNGHSVAASVSKPTKTSETYKSDIICHVLCKFDAKPNKSRLNCNAGKHELILPLHGVSVIRN